MWKYPIVDEIRKIREEHAAQFNFDIKTIIQALKEEERKSVRNIVSFAEDFDTIIQGQPEDGTYEETIKI